MSEPSAKHGGPRKITWFDVGAGLFFISVGLLLLWRGLWHILIHHELLLKTFISSILFCAVGALFALQGLKSKRPSRGQARGKVSKRHRSIKLWVLMLAIVTPAVSGGQVTSRPADGFDTREESTVCRAAPIEEKKLEAWKARAKRNSERARSGFMNSVERERKLGQRLAREIDKNVQFSADPQTEKYVTGLVRRLALSADVAVPFSVKIIETDDANVFSLPGGFLYVTTGLIRSTGSEAQLAGLLGHEVAHVLARHGSRQRKKQSIMNWASMPLMFVGPVGFLVRQVAGTTMPLKFSRDAEIEADVIGVDLVSAAGYDPSDYVNWLMSAVPCNPEAPSKFERLFDSYPVFQDRLSLIESRIADMPKRSELIVSTSEFVEIQARWSTNDVHHLGRQGPNGPTLKRR